VPGSSASVPFSSSARLRQFLRQDQQVLARRLARLPGAHETDIHQVRVTCRRLRALLKTFKPFLDEKAAVDYRRRLGRVARLGDDVREIDAIAKLPELQQEPFVPALARARRVAVQKLRRRLAGSRVAPQVQAARVGVTTHELGLADAVTESAVLHRVRHTWRRADELLARRPRAPQALHALRIRLKNCRYALEVVADLAPRPATALRHRLREAQQLLGDQRDVAAASEWLGRSDLPLPLRQMACTRLARRDRRLGRDLGRTLPQLEDAGKRWERAVTRLIERGPGDRS
jgi:CHAD domain-containing protein